MMTSLEILKLSLRLKFSSPERRESTLGQLRVKITKTLSKASKEMLQHPKIMISAFEKTGLALPLNGSLDSTKMHFQGCDVGFPPGLVIGPADSEEPEQACSWQAELTLNFKLSHTL